MRASRRICAARATCSADGSSARFRGLYDLSAPVTRYGPTCPTAAASDRARFVNVQLQNGSDGYVYIWGTEGGANNDQSPVYLARMPAKNIATGRGLEYWHRAGARAGFVPGSQKLATPLRDAFYKGALNDVTPFTFSKFNTASGLVGDHTQGTEPSAGTYTTASAATVKPPV